jgi:hypothetical protein
MIARLLAAALIMLPGAAMAQAPQRAPSQAVYTYNYDAKLVCGVQPDGNDLKLARGVYGTAVNVRNPHGAKLEIALHLALSYPPELLKPGKARSLDPIILAPGTAAAVDCTAIQALYFGYGFPAPVIKGVLSIESLQPLDVTAVWTAATVSRGGTAGELTSLDVDHIAPYNVAAELRDPEWDSEADRDARLCAGLRRTSTIVTGRVDTVSYTFDEAPDEGPREVVRFNDVNVVAGTGGVVGGPVMVRLRRGFFPDGRFVDVSEMPVFTVGRRYLLLLPNHTWLIEPVGTANTFRIETVDQREILVDQEGFAASNIVGGRLSERVSTPERVAQVPQLVIAGGDAVAAAMTLEDYLAALMTFSESCEGEVIRGPYAAFPLVPPTLFGTE